MGTNSNHIDGVAYATSLKERSLKPQEVLPLPWDNKNKPKKEIASKEHIQKVLEKYNKSKFNKI